MKTVGWWEEYGCGCFSGTVRTKKRLLGYCPKHGDSRRYIHPELKPAPTPSQEPADGVE